MQAFTRTCMDAYMNRCVHMYIAQHICAQNTDAVATAGGALCQVSERTTMLEPNAAAHGTRMVRTPTASRSGSAQHSCSPLGQNGSDMRPLHLGAESRPSTHKFTSYVSALPRRAWPSCPDPLGCPLLGLWKILVLPAFNR